MARPSEACPSGLWRSPRASEEESPRRPKVAPPWLLLEESTLVTRAAMEGELLRSPPILHASESSIGEWKALEMENAVV